MSRRLCSVGDCRKSHVARDMCGTHYARWRLRATRKICKMGECVGPVYAKDLCEPHYALGRRHGDPSVRSRARNGMGWVGNDGYRRIKIKGKNFLYHRWLWMKHHGPVPGGHELHHRNGDRGDNRIENLEVVEIHAHRSKHKREHWKRMREKTA